MGRRVLVRGDPGTPGPHSRSHHSGMSTASPDFLRANWRLFLNGKKPQPLMNQHEKHKDCLKREGRGREGAGDTAQVLQCKPGPVKTRVQSLALQNLGRHGGISP